MWGGNKSFLRVNFSQPFDTYWFHVYLPKVCPAEKRDTSFSSNSSPNEIFNRQRSRTWSLPRYMDQWVPWNWDIGSSQRTGSHLYTEHLYTEHTNRQSQTDGPSRGKFPAKSSLIPNSARTPTRMGVQVLCLWTCSSIQDSHIHS